MHSHTTQLSSPTMVGATLVRSGRPEVQLGRFWSRTMEHGGFRVDVCYSWSYCCFGIHLSNLSNLSSLSIYLSIYAYIHKWINILKTHAHTHRITHTQTHTDTHTHRYIYIYLYPSWNRCPPGYNYPSDHLKAATHWWVSNPGYKLELWRVRIRSNPNFCQRNQSFPNEINTFS